MIRRLLGAWAVPAPGEDEPGRAGLLGLLGAVALGFVAWSAVATYASVWLAADLGLSGGKIALTFAATGIAGAVGSLAGGRLAGRWRARPLMIVCSLGQALLSVFLFRRHEATGLAVAGLTAVTLLQPVRGVAQRMTLASVVSPAARERAFVGFRTAMNLGVVAGPAVLALLLLGGWNAAHAGIIALFGVAALGALFVPERYPQQSPAGFTIIRIAADVRLLGLLAVSTGAWALVSGVEIVLPAVLTRGHEIPVPEWGLAYAAASIAVVVLQSPLGNLLARFAIPPRLCLGVAALGAALAPELAIAGTAAVAATLVLFAAGELVWGPPSEEIVVALAPADRQLDYISATATTVWIGESIAAVMGFLVGQYVSPAAAWTGFLIIGAATAAGYAVLAGPGGRRTAP